MTAAISPHRPESGLLLQSERTPAFERGFCSLGVVASCDAVSIVIVERGQVSLSLVLERGQVSLSLSCPNIVEIRELTTGLQRC